MLYRRSKGEPVQYITGVCEFMGIKLRVGNGVLIPRDDSEVLVTESVKILNLKINEGEKDKPRIVDLCSGSGAIALSIAKFLNVNSDIYAIELSKVAFNYLKKNIKLNNIYIKPILGNIIDSFIQFDDNSIDVIISNPPYIPSKDIKNLDEEVKMEPLIALDGGPDGLEFYRIICSRWLTKIKDGGFIAVEIGINQGRQVKNIFSLNGLTNIKTYLDINGIPRVIIGYK